MIVAPALIVVAATGALYIFKDELEAVLYPGVTYVEPAAERVPYEQQLAAARAAAPLVTGPFPTTNCSSLANRLWRRRQKMAGNPALSVAGHA
jgi:uncharacterized iron-regulated membrane protein